MKRTNHTIVQQVCPLSKNKKGKWQIVAVRAYHEGIVASFIMEYRTKSHARWAQHLMCNAKNYRRMSAKKHLVILMMEGDSDEKA